MSKPVLVYSRDSGTKPDTAAGRHPRHTQTAPDDPEFTPRWLGVISGEVTVWLCIAALIAGCLVLGAL